LASAGSSAGETSDVHEEGIICLLNW
jgi:hypothetical protein